jgi:hypothetical protein
MDRRELIRLTGAAAAGAAATGVAAFVRGRTKSAAVASKAPPSNCDVYQGSTAGWNVWTADRRDRDLKAQPARATGELSSNPRLVERLLASYRRTFKKEHYGSMWGTIFEQNHLPIHQLFMTGTAAEAERLLGDPASTQLHTGFDTTVADFTKRLMENEAMARGLARTCKMKLVTLGDALGVTALDNPEAYCAHPEPAPAPETDELLDRIERALGFRIDFPNPFPNEFGLATRRGIAGYRAINALYQAHRIRTLVARIRNPRILEIGGGTGRTAYYAHKLGLKNYSIVDLPFTAISQGYFLGRTLGPDSVAADGDPATGDKVKLYAPETFFASRARYDLIVNVDSLTEMGLETASAYWAAIRSRAARFLSINHESNEFTVRQLPGAAPETRYPYWMRRGYVEELYLM